MRLLRDLEPRSCIRYKYPCRIFINVHGSSILFGRELQEIASFGLGVVREGYLEFYCNSIYVSFLVVGKELNEES